MTFEAFYARFGSAGCHRCALFPRSTALPVSHSSFEEFYARDGVIDSLGRALANDTSFLNFLMSVNGLLRAERSIQKCHGVTSDDGLGAADHGAQDAPAAATLLHRCCEAARSTCGRADVRFIFV